MLPLGVPKLPVEAAGWAGSCSMATAAAAWTSQTITRPSLSPEASLQAAGEVALRQGWLTAH